MSEAAVEHERLGRGVIKKSRHKGYEVFIEFENGVSRWLRFDEIHFVRDAHPESEFAVSDLVSHRAFGVGQIVSIAPVEGDWNITINFYRQGRKVLRYGYAKLTKYEGDPPQIDAPGESEQKDDSRFQARRIIEALRLGIVPYDCVDGFTFGRKSEVTKLRKWLDDQITSSMIILGEYGTGKTHLLQHLYSTALAAGFAVCFVSMDPNENPFYKPKRVYHRLVQSFRYRDPVDGRLKRFREFVRTVLNRGYLTDHRYFSNLHGNENQRLWEWIEGSQAIARPHEWIDERIVTDTELPALYDYSSAANIYCNLISALGWAAKSALGLRGLLLLFDEAETVSMSYYGYQDARAINFIRSLLRSAENREELLGLPMGSHLEYCKVGIGKEVPFIYRAETNLKLVFAFTTLDWNTNHWGSDSQHRVQELSNSERLDLTSLREQDLRDTVRRICQLYCDAYLGWNLDEDVLEKIEDMLSKTSSSRKLVKCTVEMLDLLRLGTLETVEMLDLFRLGTLENE